MNRRQFMRSIGAAAVGLGLAGSVKANVDTPLLLPTKFPAGVYCSRLFGRNKEEVLGTLRKSGSGDYLAYFDGISRVIVQRGSGRRPANAGRNYQNA